MISKYFRMVLIKVEYSINCVVFALSKFVIEFLQTSKDAVFQAEFHPTEVNSLVCCGKNQLSFWTQDGKVLTKKMALFEV